VTYRAELSLRALGQIQGLPVPAFDSLIQATVEVVDYPDDPLRTFPTSDPYVRRVEFGSAGRSEFKPSTQRAVRPMLRRVMAAASRAARRRRRHRRGRITNACVLSLTPPKYRTGRT
jgi:hypothetical protein